MQERMIDFRVNEDPTPVELSPDELKNFTKVQKDLYFTVATLSGQIKEGTLTQGFKTTLCSLIESHTTGLLKMFDYDSVLVKEAEDRHKEIRELNTENHELRRQLGEKVSKEDLREGIKNLKKTIEDWSRSVGMWAREVEFTGYTVKVNISPSISSIIHDENLHEIHAERTAKGYTFHGNGGENDRLCDFTQSNIEILRKELTERFPGAQITNIKGTDYMRRKSENTLMEMREVEFYINNFEVI